jgi:beta-glucosidase
MEVLPMKLTNWIYSGLAGLFACAIAAHGQEKTNDVESRVQQILSQMTIEEKLSYIGGTGFWDIKPIPRLGLPQIFMENGPLGIAHQPFEATTRYPAGIALAAGWSRDRALGRGRQIGRDARARGFYADLGPGVDTYRTAVGGRNFEYGAGEDPYLGSQLVVPLIQAMQKEGVWANAKHFVCNDQEYRRENIDIEADERALREIYLPPFEASVRKGHTATVMAAFNSVNGGFASQNRYLDTDILKKEWRFDGVLMSDYQSIKDGLTAAKAGMDLDMPNGSFMNSQTLLPAIQSGQLPVSYIDDKVRRILRKIVSFKFLDRPQLDPSIPLDDPTSELESLNEAREGIVLLKNNGSILPLDRKAVRSIVVLGRLAPGVPATGFGSSFVKTLNYVSELAGIEYSAGQNVRVDFITAGSPDPASSVWESLNPNGSVQAGLQAEYFNTNDLSGTPAVTRLDREVNFDWTLPNSIPTTNPATFSARWTGRVHPTYTGDHLFKVRADGGVRLFVNGQKIIDTFLSPLRPPVYGTTLPTSAKVLLMAGQAYNVRLEYRRTSGFAGDSGALQGVQFSWTPLVPPPNLSTYDAAIMCLGDDYEYEGEGLDRAFLFEGKNLNDSIRLPEFQDELINRVCAVNPRTIVVLHGGGNFDIQQWIGKVPVLLHAWFPGEFGGLALGEIVFGDVNPSGKLPITMEKHLSDNPAFANYPRTKDATTIRYTEGIFVGYRGYEKNRIATQYPFGYGLSYTQFSYSDLQISPPTWNGHDPVKVSFTVTNTGTVAGAEISQLYVGKRQSRVPRPIKELKGFEKTFLQSGESKRVTLGLNDRSFAYYNTGSKEWVVEPGAYEVLIGASSQDIRLKGEVMAISFAEPVEQASSEE